MAVVLLRTHRDSNRSLVLRKGCVCFFGGHIVTRRWQRRCCDFLLMPVSRLAKNLWIGLGCVAEGVGFEPTRPFRA